MVISNIVNLVYGKNSKDLNTIIMKIYFKINIKFIEY